MSASRYWLPLHQNLIYWPSPTATLEQSLRGIWDTASWAAVLILPQIKLNLQLSSCTSFLVHSDIWLLISGYRVTIILEHSCHLALISGHLFAFCFIWSVTPDWWSFGFVGLVWAHRHLVQAARANMEITHSKVPHSTWETLGKKKKQNFFLTDQSIAMT